MEIREDPTRATAEYASVSPAFRVTSVLDPETFATPAIRDPYIKNYDALPGNAPADWGSHFDLSQSVFLIAYDGDARVGGSVVIIESTELAVLWDIRVAPEHRGRSVGRELLAAAEARAAQAGCVAIKVETQNINVPACRFYAEHGFTMIEANAGAYPELPHEVQLIWIKPLR